jgi:hypothetical protein
MTELPIRPGGQKWPGQVLEQRMSQIGMLTCL